MELTPKSKERLRRAVAGEQWRCNIPHAMKLRAPDISSLANCAALAQALDESSGDEEIALEVEATSSRLVWEESGESRSQSTFMTIPTSWLAVPQERERLQKVAREFATCVASLSRPPHWRKARAPSAA